MRTHRRLQFSIAIWSESYERRGLCLSSRGYGERAGSVHSRMNAPEINAEGQRLFGRGGRGARAKKLIFSSSAAIYG